METESFFTGKNVDRHEDLADQIWREFGGRVPQAHIREVLAE